MRNRTLGTVTPPYADCYLPCANGVKNEHCISSSGVVRVWKTSARSGNSYNRWNSRIYVGYGEKNDDNNTVVAAFLYCNRVSLAAIATPLSAHFLSLCSRSNRIYKRSDNNRQQKLNVRMFDNYLLTRYLLLLIIVDYNYGCNYIKVGDWTLGDVSHLWHECFFTRRLQSSSVLYFNRSKTAYLCGNSRKRELNSIVSHFLSESLFLIHFGSNFLSLV